MMMIKNKTNGVDSNKVVSNRSPQNVRLTLTILCVLNDAGNTAETVIVIRQNNIDYIRRISLYSYRHNIPASSALIKYIS